MIKSIDIQNFGSFKNFVWRDSVRDNGNVLEFKRLNILYGRNYSGKTTLSRVLRCCEEHCFPENHKNPEFKITTDSTTIDHSQIAAHDLNVRVYNSDFVKDHLSFLVDHEDGEIRTFAIIGNQNQEIEKEIASKEEELGSIESETGIRWKHGQRNIYYTKENNKLRQAKDKLTDRLRRHANDVIKPNRSYGYPGYNVAAINKDIKEVRSTSVAILNIDQVGVKNSLLIEKELPNITKKLYFSPKAISLHKQADALLSNEITPTTPIQELLNDTVLQSWVRSGMPHHREKRKRCGFCRQPLPDDLWNELDAHFSKESSLLEKNISILIGDIKSEVESLNSIDILDRDSFYSSEKDSFEASHKLLKSAIQAYKKELKAIINVLAKREQNLFSSITCPELQDDGTKIIIQVDEINELITKNNNKIKSLADEKKLARNELRMNDVSQFIRDIDLDAEEAKNKLADKSVISLKNEVDKLQSGIDKLDKEIEILRIKQKDEKKGAEKVNELLNHYFGHEALKLVAIEDSVTSKFRFQIMRGAEPAYNLSEGECSLVSFCYFIARLEDAETKGKELIIYIDDPISSLDSNHIFFVFSLIESILTKPVKNTNGSNAYRYEQLFISTHNLDFFKYLKRLSRPRKKELRGEKRVSVDDSIYFMVEKSGITSKLCQMPTYLKDYTTEFNYLFHQIYKCKNADHANDNYERFYSFGNNLRKFLEAYLFYKYPYHDDKNNRSEKLIKFFGDDSTSTALITRISNELSHLEEIFDRSMRPIEIPEIPALANYVLDKIYEKDPEQYNSLLKSIGEPPRETIYEDD